MKFVCRIQNQIQKNEVASLLLTEPLGAIRSIYVKFIEIIRSNYLQINKLFVDAA